jgi:hypothetical protein
LWENLGRLGGRWGTELGDGNGITNDELGD